MQLFDSLKPNRAPRGVSAMEYGARLTRISEVEYHTTLAQRSLQLKYGHTPVATASVQPEKQALYRAPVTTPATATEAGQVGEAAMVHIDHDSRVSQAQQAVSEALGVQNQATELTGDTIINLNQGDDHEYQLPA